VGWISRAFRAEAVREQAVAIAATMEIVERDSTQEEKADLLKKYTGEFCGGTLSILSQVAAMCGQSDAALKSSANSIVKLSSFINGDSTKLMEAGLMPWVGLNMLGYNSVENFRKIQSIIKAMPESEIKLLMKEAEEENDG